VALEDEFRSDLPCTTGRDMIGSIPIMNVSDQQAAVAGASNFIEAPW
jgi:hypothetical protein